MNKIFKSFQFGFGKETPTNGQSGSESESKLRALIENVPFGMWLGDKNQRCILQSGESYRMAGNIVGKTLDEIGLSSNVVTGWQTEGPRAANGKITQSEGAWEVNGEMRDFLTIVAPVRTEDDFLGYIGVNLDITERKRNEKQMKHSADQLKMLNDIGRAITTLSDFDSVLDLIRQQIQQIIPMDAFLVLLYDPETNIISYPLVYDNGQNWPEPSKKLSLDMRSFEVLRTGKSMLVNLTEQEFEQALKNSNRSLTGDYSKQYRSFIYAPLVRQDKIIGTISATSYQFNTYTADHLELLEGVAIQAAIAIENARLFQSQQKELAERKQAEEQILKFNLELEQRVESRTIELQQANQELNHEKTHLEQYNRQRETMAAMTDLLQASITMDEASGIVQTHLKLLFPTYDGALYWANSFNVLEPVTIWGEKESLAVTFSANECWALRRGKSYRFGNNFPNPPCPHVGANVTQQAICIPLSAQGEILGNLHISVRGEQAAETMTDEERIFAETAANSIALALANLRLREKLHIQSIRDGLTGLFNRRYLDETLPREISRSERGKRPLSVLMFDIDHFKKFNDIYGHDAGDLVLRSVANVALSGIRESDIVCRYGGEEFVVILPGTPLDSAKQRADDLLREISGMELQYDGQLLGRVTISIGVASYPRHGGTRDALIKSADEAAYQAKEKGRNCVVVYG